MARHPLLSVPALLVALTVLLTWPQALHVGSKAAAHEDPLFSMWRLAWVAHTLPGDPQHLFDANIFHPHTRTLAYSDAMAFQALIAAPWLWARVNAVLVYNLLLLGGIAGSGIGMYVLVRHLTGDFDAALVSAVVFTLTPYRVEHFMHLELQWTVWMPLALWAAHRAYEEGSVRWGAATGVLLWLQAISSLYYGVFLGIMLAALAVLLLVSQPRLARGAIVPLGVGALLAAALTLPYSLPYIQATRLLGPRDLAEIATFSARPGSYLMTPQQNWLWGWTGAGVGGNELHLFPGLAAILLALAAIVRRRPYAWTYVALAALAVALSLGAHGALYRWLNGHVWILRGFRAPARFSILAFCALAVLAGFGFQALRDFVPARAQRVLTPIVIVAIAVECWSAPMFLDKVPITGSDVYRLLRTLDRSAIVELPIEYELTPQFMYQSTFHWHRLVNGYSGYEPPDYLETRQRMRTFPDDEAIGRLRGLGVRYVLVHQAFYPPDDWSRLLERARQRNDLVPIGRFRDWVADTQLFELKEQTSTSAGRGPFARP
jgi:hypothetical protein